MRRRRHQKQKLHVLISDGSIEVDNGALKIGSQLVSDMLQGVAMPGRRMPTPSFVHKELNRAPSPQDGYHVETVDPITVGKDSQLQAQDARAMWDGARNDMDTESDSQRRFEQWLMTLFAIVGAVFMFMCVGMAFQANDDGEAQDHAAGRPGGPAHSGTDAHAGAHPAPGGRELNIMAIETTRTPPGSHVSGGDGGPPEPGAAGQRGHDASAWSIRGQGRLRREPP